MICHGIPQQPISYRMLLCLFSSQPILSIDDSLPVLSIANQFQQQPTSFIDSQSFLSIALLFYRQPFFSIDSHSFLLICSHSVIMIANMLQQTYFIHRKYFLSVLMIEQWQVYLKYHQKMGLLPLKKPVSRDKCKFATKQRMFKVFAIDEATSRTLYHPS